MRLSSHRILPLVLVVTLALCLAPGRAMGVPNLMAEIMSLVLSPFAMAGNQLGQWLRPAPEGLEGPVNDPKYVLHLQDERNEFERLYVAEQAKVDLLQQQLAQAQMIASEQMHIPVRPLVARVGVRSTAPMGTVTLGRGSGHGVYVGAVAAYNQVHLLGQVIEVSPLQCVFQPLANAKSPLIDAIIVPKDRRDTSTDRSARVQLQAKGDGTLRGDVDRATPVNVDDLVKLLDDRWPPAAQGMLVGRVESVEPKETEPLRNAIVVRPQYHVSQVSYVTLKLEIQDSATQPGTSR